MPRGYSKRNEKLLKSYMQSSKQTASPKESVAIKKAGRPRKHPEGSQRLEDGFIKYTVILRQDDVESMKAIARHNAITIGNVFTEAIGSYLKSKKRKF